MRKRDRAFVAVAVAVFVLSLGSVAKANLDCSDTNWYCPEGDFQRYWYNNTLEGNAAWLDAAQDARRNEIDPTDMDTTRVQVHDNSDVHQVLGNFGDTYLGRAYCQDPSGGICRHWHIEYNSYFSLSSSGKHHVACQETGHATGLEHRPTYSPSNPTCMYDQSLIGVVLDSHDDFHINNLV